MSHCEGFVSNSDHLNPYLANAEQTSEGLNRTEQVAGVVVAQTFADRVDLVERLSVRFTRKAVASAERVLARQDGPTVLVGHSFSGMIVTEAGVHPNVSALVYVAARAPDAGEDYTALAKTYSTPPASAGIVFDGDQGSLSEEALLRDFAGDLPEAKAKVLYAVQEPFQKALLTGKTTHNAVKYTKPGGSVLLGCRQAGRNARIDVYDTGIGITEDQMARIFEAFTRLDPTCDDGLGIGLFIVRQAIGILGHRIDVASTPHRGSRFSISASGAGQTGSDHQLAKRTRPSPAKSVSGRLNQGIDSVNHLGSQTQPGNNGRGK